MAQVYGRIGRIHDGLALIAEALEIVEKSGIRIEEADMHRVQGELLLLQTVPDVQQAESAFHQALSVARSQQAKSWELRAATSLARLWQSQDKRRDAYDLLAPVYEWFTEGFDTADLKDAKALVEELRTEGKTGTA